MIAAVRIVKKHTHFYAWISIFKQGSSHYIIINPLIKWVLITVSLCVMICTLTCFSGDLKELTIQSSPAASGKRSCAPHTWSLVNRIPPRDNVVCVWELERQDGSLGKTLCLWSLFPTTVHRDLEPWRQGRRWGRNAARESSRAGSRAEGSVWHSPVHSLDYSFIHPITVTESPPAPRAGPAAGPASQWGWQLLGTAEPPPHGALGMGHSESWQWRAWGCQVIPAVSWVEGAVSSQEHHHGPIIMPPIVLTGLFNYVHKASQMCPLLYFTLTFLKVCQLCPFTVWSEPCFSDFIPWSPGSSICFLPVFCPSPRSDALLAQGRAPSPLRHSVPGIHSALILCSHCYQRRLSQHFISNSFDLNYLASLLQY